MLSGDNGLLTKVGEARDNTDIAQEKEIIALAYNSALANKTSKGDLTAVTSSELNTELANQGASATGDSQIIVTFEKSGRTYTIDSNGNINEKQIGVIGLKLNVVKKDEQTYLLEVSIEDVPSVEEWLRTLSEEELKDCFIKGMYGNNYTWNDKFNGAPFKNVKEFYEANFKSSFSDEYKMMIDKNWYILDQYNELYNTRLALNEQSIEVTNKGEFEITESGLYKVIASRKSGDKGEVSKNIVIGEKFTDIYQKTAKYTDSNGDTAYIPKGFAVGKGSLINTVVEGLVITDHVDENGNSDGNEFVWIPVKNPVWNGNESIKSGRYDYNFGMVKTEGIIPMAKLKSGTSTDYEGILWSYRYISNDLYGYGSPYADGYSSFNSSTEKEPYVTETDLQNDYKSYGITQDCLQTEFNKMIKSIENYKGFYVSRFELGLENGTTPVSKSVAKNSSVITADASNENSKKWYGLYQKSKDIYSDNSEQDVVSSMIWGSQYDAMINWFIETKQQIAPIEENYKYKKNQTTSTGAKGNRDEDIVNNIYDYWGCHNEWTLGWKSNTNRLFVNSNMSGYHNGWSPNDTPNSLSTRVALYIK